MAHRTQRLWTDEAKRSICFQATAPSVCVAQVARRYSRAILGIHINMVGVKAAGVQPTTAAEADWLARFATNLERESGYSHEQETRPLTLGFAMADCPVGMTAWIPDVDFH